jgi:hypothetical protein
LNTGSSTLASFGTIVIALTLRAIKSSMILTCCGASVLEGPTCDALTPKALPASTTPSPMRLNHGIPSTLEIFTTTFSAAWSGAEISAAPNNSEDTILITKRLFIISASLQGSQEVFAQISALERIRIFEYFYAE